MLKKDTYFIDFTMSLTLKKAILIALSLRQRGLPDIFPILKRRIGQQSLRATGSYAEHYARKDLQSLSCKSSSWSAVGLLEGPPEIKDDVAIFRFIPDVDVSINDSYIKEHFLRLAQGQKIMIIDFWNVRYISAHVIGSLVSLDRVLRNSGGYLALVNVKLPWVVEKLKTVKLYDYFLVSNSIDEAINEINSRRIRQAEKK